MGKKRYEIIDEEKYLKHSIHDFNRTIESINSLNLLFASSRRA